MILLSLVEESGQAHAFATAGAYAPSHLCPNSIPLKVINYRLTFISIAHC